jgi:hypothetical protein
MKSKRIYKFNEMHTKPLLQDLEAKAVSDNCIKITINEDLSLDTATIKILGPNRNLMLLVKPTSYTLDVCFGTGEPTFVELHTSNGSSVQYVKGSGGDFYKK